MNPEELQQAIESFKAAMEMLPASMQNTVERLNETVELLNQTNDKLKKTAETASGTKPKAEAATGGGASRQSQDFRRSADSLQKIYEELKKAKQEKKTEVTLNPEQLKALNLNKEQQRKLKIDDKRNPYLNVKVDTSKLEKILKETEKVKLQSVEEFRYFSERFTSLGSVVKEGTRIFQDNNKANLGLISTTTLMTAAFTGAKDAVTGYIKSVMDGQRGASVSAKALTDFTSSVTTAAKGISYAMLFIPGLGLGLKALALGVGLASEAVDLAAKVNEMGAKQADNLFAAFNELGKAGASGSKGIMGVYENLQDLGYSTNEVAKYQSLVVSNSKDLAMFGPTVSQGANKFVEVAKEISGQGKELGKRFQALGITSEEQNEHILKYMGLQAKQGTLQGRTTEELRKGAAAYIEELDTMARLTGASRKEIEQQREAAASDEQLQAALFEAEGDPERTKEIQEAINTVANLRYLGKDVEATGIAKMVAGRGALGFKEAQTLAMQGITYEGLKSAGGAEAQTRMVVAAGGQMARRVGTTGTLTGELAGAGNMMGSGFYRQRVAEGGLKFVDGKIVKAEEAAAAAKGEQQQMMNQTEPVTKALIDGMDKQRELALTIDRSLKDTFLNAVNINKTASEAVAKAAKEFESGMKYLKSLKALGIEGPADFALKGTMIVAVASAVLSFLATKQLGKILGGALEGLKGGAAGAARGAAGAASGAAAGAGGFARGTGRAARAGRTAGGLGAGPRVGGGFASRAAESGMSLKKEARFAENSAFNRTYKRTIGSKEDKYNAATKASKDARREFFKEARTAKAGGTATGARTGLSTVAGKQGPSMGSKLTDLGEGVGGLVGGILKGVGTGGGVLIEAVLTGLAKGIAAMANPMFVLGAGALGLAITAIGTGIAGAAWIMGKALPTFAEGLKSFSDIDGENLKDVGLGVTALGAGLAVFGAGGLASSFANVASNVIDGLVGFFGGKTPFDKIKEFSKLDIDGPKLKVNAEALKVFAEAMTALSGSGATITGTIAEGLSRFFEVKTPWDKFIEFSKLPIKDSSKVETNAKALAAFASAISLLKGNATFSEVAMDSVSKFFNLQTPWDKFVQFSRVDLGDSDRITKNANALKAFNDAMSGYKGAGSGFGAWLGNFDALNVDFAKIGERIRSFVGEFESLPLGSKDRIIIASEVLKAFDDSVGSFKGAGAGVGAALNNIDWLNVDFTKISERIRTFIFEFEWLPIESKERITLAAGTLKTFDEAISSYKGAGAGVGAALNNIDWLNVDFSKIAKRIETFVKVFDKLPADSKDKVVANAQVLKAFDEAISSYKGAGGGVTAWISNIIPSMSFDIGLLKVKLEKFSSIDIKKDKVISTAQALKAFDEAINSYRGSGGGVTAWISNMIPSMSFDIGLLKVKLEKFSSIDIKKDKVVGNAEALKAFDAALSSYKGAGAGVGAWLNNIQFLNVDLEKVETRMKDFSKLDIKKEQIVPKAEALAAFDAALSSYKGAGAGVGAALNNIDWLNVDFSKINSQMVSFSKIDAKKDRIVATADALKAFDDAMSSYKGAGAGIGAWLNNIGKLNVDLSQVEKRMKDFSKIDVKREEIVPKAEALKAFDEAVGSYRGAGVGTWLKNIEFLDIDLAQIEKRMKDFSKIDVKKEEIVPKAEALKAFDEALSSYSGAGSGVGAWLSNIVPAMTFDIGLLKIKLENFSKIDVKKEQIVPIAEALKAFDEALSSYSGAGTGITAWLSNIVPAMTFDISLLKIKIENFNAIKVDKDTIVANAEALKAFDAALSSYKGAGTGFKTWIQNLAESFGGGVDISKIAKKILEFSKIQIQGRPEDFKNKAEGFKLFAEAIEKFSDTKITKGASMSNIVADNLSKRFGGKTIIERFEEFASMKLDEVNFNKNTELFKKFVESMGMPDTRTMRQGSTGTQGQMPSAEREALVRQGINPDEVGKGASAAAGKGESANAKKAMEYFMKQGWTKEQAAGIVGNLQQESGKDLSTTAHNKKENAQGIAQWRGDRLSKFKEMYGKDVKDASFEEQLEYIQWELKNTEKKAGDALKQAKTAQAAAAVVDKKYERSAGTELSQRTSNALALAGGGETTQTAGTPSPAAPSTVSTIASEEILKKHGLRIKKGDVHKEGAELDPRMLDLASKIQETIPGFNVFTGFNDQFHNEKAPRSLHAKGKAVDFTVAKPPTKEEGQEIVRALNGMGFAHAIDEYNNPSRQATGGHFHAQLQAKNGGMFEGPKSGYAVQLHGKEAVLPMTNPQVTKESLSKLFADMEWGKSNTIADKLEQVLTQIRSSSTNITPTSNDDLVMQLLEKVDTMIDVLESSRRIQDTQLRHLRA